jgi:hypothetical protein
LNFEVTDRKLIYSSFFLHFYFIYIFKTSFLEYKKRVSMLLSGKLAIITGAGIGYAIAEGFAADGATVVLADIKTSVHEAANELNEWRTSERTVL